MAREYKIAKMPSGPDLRISGETMSTEHHILPSASDEALIREAERIIQERFYSEASSFPGFDWEPTSKGWQTSDEKMRSE